jgi:uncharacterized protein (DUF433 family)
MAAIEIAPGTVVDEKVCFGKPVVKGIRVPVVVVLHELTNGMSPEESAEEYDITVVLISLFAMDMSNRCCLTMCQVKVSDIGLKAISGTCVKLLSDRHNCSER